MKKLTEKSAKTIYAIAHNVLCALHTIVYYRQQLSSILGNHAQLSVYTQSAVSNIVTPVFPMLIHKIA